jgi:hypothetical protein
VILMIFEMMILAGARMGTASHMIDRTDSSDSSESARIAGQ